MKRDHLTPAELSAYAARELSPAEVLGASDHLAVCEECRARLLQQVGARPPDSTAGAADDPSYEELSGWLDDELDPLTRRDVEAMLAHSPRARAALADLSAFRDEINALPPRVHGAEGGSTHSTVRSFSRWILPLAALLVSSIAGTWWVTSSTPGGGTYVKLTDGARTIAFAADGRSPALTALPSSVSEAVAETIRTGRLAPNPELAALAGETGTLAGSADGRSELRVLEPVATAVRDVQPRFRWSAAADVSGYRINVVEETSGSLITSAELPATATEWVPPEPLPAGEVYQWEVQALRDGNVIANSPKPPEPEARFRILSAAIVAELEEARRASKGSHLVMGVANARAGLLEDALREFRALAEQNRDAELPRQLVRQLEAQRAPAG